MPFENGLLHMCDERGDDAAQIAIPLIDVQNVEAKVRNRELLISLGVFTTKDELHCLLPKRPADSSSSEDPEYTPSQEEASIDSVDSLHTPPHLQPSRGKSVGRGRKGGRAEKQLKMSAASGEANIRK
jgi:hypothetical protein